MTDSRPEPSVRNNGVHVWLSLKRPDRIEDIPLSGIEACDLGSQLIQAGLVVAPQRPPEERLDQATIDEAVRLGKERKAREQNPHPMCPCAMPAEVKPVRFREFT